MVIVLERREKIIMSDTSKIKLTKDRVEHSKEYMHKDLPDGTEVCL